MPDLYKRQIQSIKMAKPINVESLLQASKSLDAEAFHRFLVHYGVEIKDYEIKDLNELVRRLRGSGCSVANLSNFFVGYKIPQISKDEIHVHIQVMILELNKVQSLNYQWMDTSCQLVLCVSSINPKVSQT